MNLIIVYEQDFISGNANRILLTGKRFEHILKVHKAEKGKILKVGLINSAVGTGVVEEINSNSIEMRLTFGSPPPPPTPVTVICALPRPKTVKKVLHIISSMGIKRCLFINSFRVEKSYWQSPVLQRESIESHCVSGLQQAGDTILPVIELKKLFKPFVEDELELLSRDTHTLVAHPYTDTSLSDHCSDNKKPVTLVIGPEGGFVEYEIELLKHRGFTPVSIGLRTLRVEYALASILGKFL